MKSINKSPIRVLHIIGIMDRGGAETMIMNLYRNIDREKVQFDFVENSFEPAAYDEEILALGGRIYRCPHFVGKNYSQYRKWWYAFFEKYNREYHIVHGHIGSCSTIYLKIARKYGMYTIAHSHSSYQSLLYRISAYGTRYVADYYFGCSKEALEDRYGKKIANSDKSRVLVNAIDTHKFAYDEKVRDDVRKEFKIDSDIFVVGQVGRFMPVKNHIFTIDVFSEFLSKNEKAKLFLVGEGPLKEKIMEHARRKGILKNIMFTGSRSDVNRLLQAMDVLIMPSEYEGLGIAAIEAQCSGLPCVMSNGIPDEAILAQELCTRLSLKDHIEIWTNSIEKHKGYCRKDFSSIVTQNGYDIKQSSKWIEEFYLSRN